jgi:hypothetical protein
MRKNILLLLIFTLFTFNLANATSPVFIDSKSSVIEEKIDYA